MNFHRYMKDFYGPEGVYNYGFTDSEINLATQLYKTRLPAYGFVDFEGDSVDREHVRDIILYYRGDKFTSIPLAVTEEQ